MSANLGRGLKVDAAGIYGVDPDGEYHAVAVDADGNLLVASGASLAPTVVGNPTVTNVSVGTTAGGTALAAASAGRLILGVFNNDASVTMYVGPSGVTTTTGFPIPPQSGMVWGVEDTGASKALYGIVASGTLDARVWSQS